MRHFERATTDSANAPSKNWRVLCAGALSLVIAYADYREAGTSREAARYFRKRFHNAGAQVWFQSHWGFQWYMQQWGAKPFVKAAAIPSGSVMIVPSNNADPAAIPRASVIPVDEITLRSMPFIATFAPGTGAGFYSSVRGPVPWVIGHVLPQRCEAVVFR
jgi:hypothetical protein